MLPYGESLTVVRELHASISVVYADEIEVGGMEEVVALHKEAGGGTLG